IPCLVVFKVSQCSFPLISTVRLVAEERASRPEHGRRRSVFARLSFGLLFVSLVLIPAASAFAQTSESEPPPGLKLSVASVSDTVRQYQQAEAHVTVENAATVALTISKAEVEPSDGLRVCPSFDSPPAQGSDGCDPQTAPMPLTVGPGDAVVLRWVISVP